MQRIELQFQLFQAGISDQHTMDDSIQPGQIMIVTHRANMAQAIALPLELCGHYIIVADDTNSAMSMIMKQAPGLIILDQETAQINAGTLCAFVKNNPTTWHIPILVVAIDVDALAVSDG